MEYLHLELRLQVSVTEVGKFVRVNKPSNEVYQGNGLDRAWVCIY